jgi:hypothetical protein
MKRLILCFTLAMAASAVASSVLGPSNFLDIILRSPQGLVLIGRTMMVFSVVYPATGNTLLSAFAAIMFNNTIALTAVLASPPLIHSTYEMGLKKRRAASRLFRWPGKTGWGFYRGIMAAIAMMYVAAFAVQVPAIVAVRGPALFMPIEAAHVLLAAVIVHRASELEPDGFMQQYKRMLTRLLPIVLLLLTISAAVEAYEALQ